MRYALGSTTGIRQSATHSTLANYVDAMGLKEVRRRQVFSVIRNPFTRFLSAWNYLRNQTPSHPYYWADAGERCAIMRYDTPVEFILDMQPYMAQFPHFAPQHCWLRKPEKVVEKMPVSLLCFEDLAKAWAKFSAPYGLDPLPHLNQSKRQEPHRGVPSILSITCRQIYAEDYRLWDRFKERK